MVGHSVTDSVEACCPLHQTAHLERRLPASASLRDTRCRFRAPQVGAYDIVIEVGGRLLATWESRQFRRDVLLSMALARCGLAGEHFERQAVASGCVLSPCTRVPYRVGLVCCRCFAIWLQSLLRATSNMNLNACFPYAH